MLPNPVARIYGKPPTVPQFPLHVVLPVPAGAHDWSDVTSSPLSIGCPATNSYFPTQWTATNRDANGQVTAVELIANVTPTHMLSLETPGQSYSGLSVYATPTPPAAFALDQRILELIGAGIKFTVKGEDADYQATILPNLETLMIGPVRARAFFSHKVAPLEPGDHDLPNFGWIEGFLTAYTDSPIIKLELLWHTGEIESAGTPQPMTAAYHDAVQTVLPAGWAMVPLSRGPNLPLLQFSDGVTPINFIPAAADPYTTRGQLGWTRTYMILPAELARSYSPLRYNGGFFSTTAYDADKGHYNALNPTLHESVARYPMPAIGKNLAIAYRNSMGSFLAQRDSGAKHGSGNYSPLVGYRHPMWGWGGAETGGSGINFAECVGFQLAAHETEYSYLLSFMEGIVDRQAGFLTVAGEPVDPYLWAGDPLKLTLNQQSADQYGGKTPLWLEDNGDGAGFKAAWNADPVEGTNGVPGTTGGGYADATRMEHLLYKNAVVDGQHASRILQQVTALAKRYGNPIAQRLLVHWAMQFILDEPDPAASTTLPFAGFETGYGSRVTRQHGWVAQVAAEAYAYCNTTQKTVIQTWAGKLVTHLEQTRLPNGGFCAWNHNKEYEDARDELGTAGGDGAVAVTQSYQEIIISQGLHRLRKVGLFGERIRKLIRENMYAWMAVYKSALPPTQDDVYYRIGVWQEEEEHGAPVPGTTPLWFDQAKALYISVNKDDKYYYQHGLALAMEYLETPEEKAFIDFHLAALFGSKAAALTTIPSTKSNFENAETLLARLQNGG